MKPLMFAAILCTAAFYHAAQVSASIQLQQGPDHILRQSSKTDVQVSSGQRPVLRGKQE
eukprot:jgi/Botrbrau1/21956/Bobra.0249s0079.1